MRQENASHLSRIRQQCKDPVHIPNIHQPIVQTSLITKKVCIRRENAIDYSLNYHQDTLGLVLPYHQSINIPYNLFGKANWVILQSHWIN